MTLNDRLFIESLKSCSRNAVKEGAQEAMIGLEKKEGHPVGGVPAEQQDGDDDEQHAADVDGSDDGVLGGRNEQDTEESGCLLAASSIDD